MEWYFENQVEDLVVPKDYEQQEEVVTSPESWSQWGMTAFPRKNFDSNANMTREELAFNGGKNFYTSIDNERSTSNNSSMNQQLYNNNGGSLLWNNQADFQQFTQEEARINHMDDIFFNSLLEEDPTRDSTEPQDNTINGNNTNMFDSDMLDSQNVGSHGLSTGSSKYLKTHAFSPSTDWVNEELATTCQMPKHCMSDENSMEESVLNDLERVTAQFTDKTRICFRDALYRLAESSKLSINSFQDGEAMMTSDDDTMRVGEIETEDSESKTNVIDRAVANLMFNRFDYEDEINDQQHQIDYNNDAEVPIGGMQELPQPTIH
uniref:protein LNK3-like n=1 Tax=Erigeron canadensis TaxID=72917 RepID=UPI001CB93E1E|nr:protein LNK3-like [Erigeron canadensis]